MDKGVNAIRDQSKSIPSSGICNILPRSVMTIHCPAILSFPALLQLRQLGNLGFIRACASNSATVLLCQPMYCANVPLCQPLCHCASQCRLHLLHTLPPAKCPTDRVSSSQPEPRSHCHLPHTPSNAHTHTLIHHNWQFSNIGYILPRNHSNVTVNVLMCFWSRAE